MRLAQIANRGPHMGQKTVATRIARSLEAELRDVMREEGVDRSTAVRKLLEIGASEWRRKRALELYRGKKVSLWGAASIAGLTLREMLDVAKREGVPAHVSVEDIEEDMRAAREAERE